MSNTYNLNRHWYHLTPDRFLVALLTSECFLLLSERFHWLGLNEGVAALVAVMAVGLTLLLMLFWFLAARLFRRLFQFSLRSLLLLLVAIAIGCSMWATEIQRERSQWEAARAIKKAGGVVWSEPTWLGKIFRDDSLVRVYAVSFAATPTTDAELVHLQRLTQLRGLWLGKTKITNAGLVHLQRLTRLRVLKLDNTQVTDTGLVHLQGLSQLLDLGLGNTPVANTGLVHLQGLSHLIYLDLHNTNVTDAGLVHLQGLKQLQRLNLSNTNVTDAGLVHLQGLKQLEMLWLNNTQVTDAGLVHLRGLCNLVDLFLVGTKVTEKGEKILHPSLPNCVIF